MAYVRIILFIKIMCCLLPGALTDTVDERLLKLEGTITIQQITVEKLEQYVKEMKSENEGLREILVLLENRAEHQEKRIEELNDEVENLKVNGNRGHTGENRNASYGNEEAESKRNVQRTDGIPRRNINRIRRLSGGQTANVAFHASMSSNGCFHVHEPYVFDVEEVDVGNGYNANDGIYVVPVSGTYVFTFTIAAPDHYYIRPEIVVNGRVKGASISDSDDSSDIHPATVVVVVGVTDGDHVFVRSEKSNTCTVMSDVVHGRSSFSGWLLF